MIFGTFMLPYPSWMPNHGTQFCSIYQVSVYSMCNPKDYAIITDFLSQNKQSNNYGSRHNFTANHFLKILKIYTSNTQIWWFKFFSGSVQSVLMPFLCFTFPTYHIQFLCVYLSVYWTLPVKWFNTKTICVRECNKKVLNTWFKNSTVAQKGTFHNSLVHNQNEGKYNS